MRRGHANRVAYHGGPRRHDWAWYRGARFGARRRGQPRRHAVDAMRTAQICGAVLAHALRLELDVDGRRLHLEYEESNLWEARFRYAEAFVAAHDLAKYKGLGCEEVLYARHKCVASRIEEAMKAHRDRVRSIMRQWVSSVNKETVALNADGEEDTTWLRSTRRLFRGCALDAAADPPSRSCRNSLH